MKNAVAGREQQTAQTPGRNPGLPGKARAVFEIKLSEVKASFDEVNQAQQKKKEAENMAQGEYNREVPKARGDADRRISKAKGYATQRINEAEGDAAKFTALYKEYQKSPEVTRRRIYLETMERVMPKLGKKVIIDESANQVLPLLPLDSLGK